MTFWSDKRVLVTGGTGFLGSHVTNLLREFGADVVAPRSMDYDLVHHINVERLYLQTKPEIVIHLAAKCGGIGANINQPGSFFYENLIMGINMMEEARVCGVKKFVSIGTVCSYPKFTPTPFVEEDIWNGYPEETNAPYGLAKKMALVQAQAYRMQYGFNAIHLIPTNLYGPGDNFDLDSSHVIPAMIRRFVEANHEDKTSVTLWGTGTPTRDFLYVEDAAQAIIAAAENYDGMEPVNVGSGQEVSMRDLAVRIADLVDYKGEIKWDPFKPDGQPRRMLNTDRALKLFGFHARTMLGDGLQKTIDWYRNNWVVK